MNKLNPIDLILWHDDILLIVNKPAGLLTLVDGYDPKLPFLVGLLKSVFNPLWVVHRLDRETSGVMVFARTPEAHRALNTQFERRQAFKTYHALVTGSPTWIEKLVDLPLRPDGDRKHRTVVDPHRGKPSATNLRVLERIGRFTLVEAIPRTGRTHQIRVHLGAQGHPVVVDPLYGDGRAIMLSELNPAYKGRKEYEAPLLGRLGLHAHSLTLTHPMSGEELCFDAPYPQDLVTTLRYLHKYST